MNPGHSRIYDDPTMQELILNSNHRNNTINAARYHSIKVRIGSILAVGLF